MRNQKGRKTLTWSFSFHGETKKTVKETLNNGAQDETVWTVFIGNTKVAVTINKWYCNGVEFIFSVNVLQFVLQCLHCGVACKVVPGTRQSIR